MHAFEKAKFGPFYGTDLSDTDLARLFYQKIQHVPEARRGRQERALIGTKWFDYRFMGPVLATFYYAQCYGEVHKRLFARHIDREAAERMRGAKYANIFEDHPSRVTGLWRGRQHADAIGMPYDLYIELAMERGMRYKRDYLPAPQQLYSEDAVKAAFEGWRERLTGRIYVATDPRYRNDHYIGQPSQINHRIWVLGQIERRPPIIRLDILKHYLINDPVITDELVAERFGADTLQLVRS